MLIHFMKIFLLIIFCMIFESKCILTWLNKEEENQDNLFFFHYHTFVLMKYQGFLINFQIFMILNKWNNIQCQQLNNSINIPILLFTYIEIFDHKLLKILKYLKFEITISFDKENVRSTKSKFIDLHFSLLAKNLIGMQKIVII